MGLPELIKEKGFQTTLIVDDAFDEVPTGGIISQDRWNVFFDDLTAGDKEIMLAFPDYDKTDPGDLAQDDEFVNMLWSRREEFNADNINYLFEEYCEGQEGDLRYLHNLQDKLTGWGLTCLPLGANFANSQPTADIIFVDLFLDPRQRDDDISIAIQGLKRIIPAMERPPIVILMSSNPRIEQKRNEFRDETGLYESTFRIISKVELADGRKLERKLTRLVDHYDDSIKLSSFLDSWVRGLNNAKDNVAELIRKLDLPDLAQINQLLLSAEGQPTGSYLVDTFDRVLLHEIERDSEIIEKATALNTITSASYPPPYLVGARDLQDLVFKSSFQNSQRLQLKSTIDSAIGFGDIYMPVKDKSKHHILRGLTKKNVLLVITPACDLQRNKTKRVLLMVGELVSLKPETWSTTSSVAKTPIIQIEDGEKATILWDNTHLETASAEELNKLVEDQDDGLAIVARMRETNVLNLQQIALAELGRVGLLGQMPASFQVSISAYYVNTARKFEMLNIGGILEGISYVGRETTNITLSLGEAACDQICDAIDLLNIDLVHTRTKSAVQYIKDTDELSQAFTTGMPLNANANPQAIKSPSGVRINKDNPESEIRTIGFVIPNDSTGILDDTVNNRFLHYGGVFISTLDQPILDN